MKEFEKHKRKVKLMRKSLGFTLAEVLITLAIIGVVAAMTIPSVIVRTNQQEFKSGFKKAVSVLNQAITMNIAIDSESPADTTTATELFNYLTRRLNVIKTVATLSGGSNAGFYTADGFRFEVPKSPASSTGASFAAFACGNPAGGAVNNVGTAVTTPCLVLVDVNGDKTPNPKTPGTYSGYTMPAANSTRVIDIFTVMITDVGAIPYGTVAQRTMFQAE